MAVMVSLTVGSINNQNLLSTKTFGFNPDHITDLMAKQTGNSSLTGNSQFSYLSATGKVEFYTVTENYSDILTAINS